jgi:hypothetical protein
VSSYPFVEGDGIIFKDGNEVYHCAQTMERLLKGAAIYFVALEAEMFLPVNRRSSQEMLML